MALPSTTVWELRTDGDDANGGGFNSIRGGQDYTYGAGYQIVSLSDLIVDTGSTLRVRSASRTPVNNDLGNFLKLPGGSGFTSGTFEIQGVTNTGGFNWWTLDASAGTGGSTGGTGKIGGGRLSLGNISWGNGHIAWMRGGTYNYSTTQTIGGMVNGGTLRQLRGYGTFRGDGCRPLISSTAPYAIESVGSPYVIYDIEIDGNDTCGVGIYASNYGSAGTEFVRCRISRCTTYGIAAGETACIFDRCEVFDMASGSRIGILCVGGQVLNCTVRNSPCWGICGAYINMSRMCIIGCLVYDCTIGILASHETYDAGGHTILIGNVIYGCSSHATYLPNSQSCPLLRNNIIYDNGGRGIYAQSNRTINSDYNAFGANSPNYQFPEHQGANDVILTANPFTNASAGDFSLNNLVGGGQACRSTGYPGLFPAGLTTGYTNIGVQHQSVGGLRRGDFAGGFNG